MNFELRDRLQQLINIHRLAEAISFAEGLLKSIPETDFHKILGKNLLHLMPNVSSYLTAFHNSTIKELENKLTYSEKIFNLFRQVLPAAYLCEMNGFTINYDRWYINIFSYKIYDLSDWRWLSDFYDMTSEDLTISGYEDIQKAFQDVHENNRFEEKNISEAYDICELLIILRLHELFKETYNTYQLDWKKIPLFVEAHDYDFIYWVNGDRKTLNRSV